MTQHHSDSHVRTAQQILDFWIQAGPDKWFAKDADFDRAFADLCSETHYAAARGELNDWMDTPEGALALIILLDQLPRNAFRETAHMFAKDPLALNFAREAIRHGHDRSVSPDLRPFILMPLMHSEDLKDQEHLLTLLNEESDPKTYRFAVIHRDIIAKFGRFPHRNDCLGRSTSQDESAFLKSGGFSG